MGHDAIRGYPGRLFAVGTLLAMALFLVTGARQPRTEPDFLLDSDMLFEGTVLTAESVYRPRHGGLCGWNTNGLPLVDYSVRVDRLIQGVVSSDTVLVTQMKVTSHELKGTGSGERVLVYGSYNCGDGGRLWGRLAPRSQRHDGYIHETVSFAGDSRPSPPFIEIRDQYLDAAFAAGRQQARRAGALPLAIGLFVVNATEGGTASGSGKLERISVTPLGMIGTLPSIQVRELRGAGRLQCRRSVQVGDTLALPMRPADAGRVTYSSPDCLSRFRLESGFARYYGLPLDQMRARLNRNDGAFRIVLPSRPPRTQAPSRGLVW